MIMCAAINGTWFGPRTAKVEREVGPDALKATPRRRHFREAPQIASQ